MAVIPGFENALGWAHFRLRGGWRNLCGSAIGYFVVLGLVILFSLRIDPTKAEEILYGWTIGLTALQIGILVLFAGSTVRTAVRKDFTTGMIASHRLMPVSGTEAIAGYLLGSTPQPLAVAGANLLLGVLVAAGAQLPVINWLAANMIILTFAVCAWVVIAAMAFLAPKAAGLFMAFILIGGFSGGMALTVLPALTVICSPVLGPTVFGIMRSGLSWNWAYQISLMSQFAVLILAYVAAARKFRRDDVLAMGPLLGLAHLAVWVVMSITGIVYWLEFQPVFGMSGADIAHIQIMTSTLAMILIALVPLSAAAWLQTDYRRRRRLNDPSLGRRPLDSVTVTLMASAAILALPAFAKPIEEVSLERLIRTAVTLTAALLPLGYLFRILYRFKSQSGMIVALWIGLTWAGPWIAHFAFLIARGQEVDDRELLGTLATGSPIGSLMAIWSELPVENTPGLIWQAALALGMAVLFHVTQRSGTPTHVPLPA